MKYLINRLPPAQDWRKIVSRGKYPLLFVYELNQGLLGTHYVVGFSTAKLKNYCRISGGSYLYEPEVRPFIARLSQVLQTQPLRTLEWIKDYDRVVQKLYQWLKRLPVILEHNDVPVSKLRQLYSEYERHMQFLWRWAYLPFLMDDAIEIELRRALIGRGIPVQRIPEVTSVVGVSPKFTMLQQEELILLKLAEKVARSGFERCARHISAHHGQWQWKNSWIYFQYPLSRAALEREIVQRIRKNPSKIAANIRREKQIKLRNKERILRKLGSPHVRQLARVLSEFTFWHSYKMEEMTQAVHLAKPLLERLADVMDLRYEQLLQLTPLEVIRGKIDRREVAARLRASGVLMLNGRMEILTGARLKLVQRKMEQRSGKVQEIFGLVVSPGKARGRVCVIPSGEVDVSKISIPSGSIVVTSMTTTNMVPLIRHAAAIVTDEGGITCHAAIISRELKIPCVVGTQIATKVLKNGDRVEVDADNGTVKIIS